MQGIDDADRQKIAGLANQVAARSGAPTIFRPQQQQAAVEQSVDPGAASSRLEQSFANIKGLIGEVATKGAEPIQRITKDFQSLDMGSKQKHHDNFVAARGLLDQAYKSKQYLDNFSPSSDTWAAVAHSGLNWFGANTSGKLDGFFNNTHEMQVWDVDERGDLVSRKEALAGDNMLRNAQEGLQFLKAYGLDKNIDDDVKSTLRYGAPLAQVAADTGRVIAEFALTKKVLGAAGKGLNAAAGPSATGTGLVRGAARAAGSFLEGGQGGALKSGFEQANLFGVHGAVTSGVNAAVTFGNSYDPKMAQEMLEAARQGKAPQSLWGRIVTESLGGYKTGAVDGALWMMAGAAVNKATKGAFEAAPAGKPFAEARKVFAKAMGEMSPGYEEALKKQAGRFFGGTIPPRAAQAIKGGAEWLAGAGLVHYKNSFYDYITGEPPKGKSGLETIWGSSGNPLFDAFLTFTAGAAATMLHINPFKSQELPKTDPTKGFDEKAAWDRLRRTTAKIPELQKSIDTFQEAGWKYDDLATLANEIFNDKGYRKGRDAAQGTAQVAIEEWAAQYKVAREKIKPENIARRRMGERGSDQVGTGEEGRDPAFEKGDYPPSDPTEYVGPRRADDYDQGDHPPRVEDGERQPPDDEIGGGAPPETPDPGDYPPSDEPRYYGPRTADDYDAGDHGARGYDDRTPVPPEVAKARREKLKKAKVADNPAAPTRGASAPTKKAPKKVPTGAFSNPAERVQIMDENAGEYGSKGPNRARYFDGIKPEDIADEAPFQERSGTVGATGERPGRVTGPYDVNRGGTQMYFKPKNGRLITMEGHQRVSEAKKSAAGQPVMKGPVFFEDAAEAARYGAKPTTREEARDIASLTNIRAGSFDVGDALRVLNRFRRPGESGRDVFKRLGISTRGEYERASSTAEMMMDADPSLAGAADRGYVTWPMASEIARRVKNHAIQRAALEDLRERQSRSEEPLELSAVTPAIKKAIKESFGERADDEGDGEPTTLGDPKDDLARSIANDIADRIITAAGRERRAFAGAVKNQEELEKVQGNVLNAAENEKRLKEAREAVAAVQALMGKKNELSAMVMDAARKSIAAATPKEAARIENDAAMLARQYDPITDKFKGDQSRVEGANEEQNDLFGGGSEETTIRENPETPATTPTPTTSGTPTDYRMQFDLALGRAANLKELKRVASKLKKDIGKMPEAERPAALGALAAEVAKHEGRFGGGSGTAGGKKS